MPGSARLEDAEWVGCMEVGQRLRSSVQRDLLGVPDGQRPGPPPSLRSTATVLAATRGKGVDRMPLPGRAFRTDALENEGQALGCGPKDRQLRAGRRAGWVSPAI